MKDREEFLQEYKEEIERAKRYGRLFSLCLFSINDSEEIVKILDSNLRFCDSYFKYNENEIILILPETDKKGTINLCERILEQVKSLNLGKEININCGISTYRIDTIDKEKLLEKCRNALENAVNRGKNQLFAFYPLTKFSVEFFQWFEKNTRIKFKRARLILIISVVLLVTLLIVVFSLSESLKVRKELLFEKSQLQGNWKLAILENFDGKNVLQKWFVNKGEWEVKDGSLVAKGVENYITLKSPFNGNIRMEYTAWIPKENKAVQDLSCFIHNSADNTFPKLYFFGFGEQKNTKTSIERAGIKIKKDYNMLITRGERYKMVFEYVNDTLRGFINDKLVLEYVDLMPLLTLEKRYIGLYSWGHGQHYDNLKVYVHETGMSINVFRLGDDYFYNGFYDKAIEKYNEIYESHKVSEVGAKALYKTGLCYQLLKKEIKTMEIFDKIINNYPSLGISAYARIQKARMFMEDKNFNKALEELGLLHKIKDLGQIREELEFFYLEMLKITRTNFSYDVSLKVCEKILKLNIYDIWLKGNTYTIMARIYMNLGKFKESKEIYDEIINNKSYPVLIRETAKVERAYVAYLNDATVAEMQELQNIIEQDSRNDPEIKTVQFNALITYFNILRDTRQTKRAFKFINEVLEAHVAFKEKQKEIDFYRAQIYHGEGNYDMSIEHYLKAVNLSPDLKTAYLWIADAFVSSKKISEARKYWVNLLASLEKDIKKDEALLRQVNYLLGRTDIALIKKTTEGINNIFVRGTYYYIIGVGLESQGKISEANKYYNKVLKPFKVHVWPGILAAVKLSKYQKF